MNALVPLRDGTTTRDRRLDRCRQFDARSLGYSIRPKLTTEQRHNPPLGRHAGAAR